jgi:hypothetical protein
MSVRIVSGNLSGVKEFLRRRQRGRDTLLPFPGWSFMLVKCSRVSTGGWASLTFNLAQ